MQKIKSLMAIATVVTMFCIIVPVNSQTNNNNTSFSERATEDSDTYEDVSCGWVGLVGMLGLLGLLGLRKKIRKWSFTIPIRIVIPHQIHINNKTSISRFKLSNQLNLVLFFELK